MAAAKTATTTRKKQQRRNARRKLNPAMQPGYNNQMDVGADIVESPYVPGTRENVHRNFKTDPLEYIYKRGGITKLQYEAGKRLQTLFYDAQLDCGMGIDYTRIKVDSSGYDQGKVPLAAMQKLKEVQTNYVTRRQWVILSRVLYEGCTITQVAEKIIGVDTRKIFYITQTFRDALEDVAPYFKLK